MKPTTRKKIREQMAEDYHRLGTRKSYDAVGSFWGITGGMAHRIINQENYWPKDRKILKQLDKVYSIFKGKEKANVSI